LKGAWLLVAWGVWAAAYYVPATTGYAHRGRWAIATLVGGIGWLMIMGKGRTLASKILLPISLLVVLSAVSASYSHMAEYSFLRAANFALLVGGSVGITAALATHPGGLRQIFFVLLLSSFVGTLVIAVSGVAADVDILDVTSRFQGIDQLRATGAAGLIASSMPLLMWCSKYSKPSWKTVYLLFGAYLTVLMLATKARSGIGMAIVTWPLAWSLLSNRTLSGGMIALILVGLLGGGLVQNSQTARRFLRLEGKEDLSTGRFERWEECLEKWQDSPVQGHGFGTSRYHHIPKSVASWTLSRNRNDQKVTHNEHITVLYELGVLGLAAYWAALIAVGAAGLKAIRMPVTPIRNLVVVVFISWCASVMNTMAHDPNLTAGHPGAFSFWIRAAFVCCGLKVLTNMNQQRTQSAQMQDRRTTAAIPRMTTNMGRQR
jgi:O-antigen ligase